MYIISDPFVIPVSHRMEYTPWPQCEDYWLASPYVASLTWGLDQGLELEINLRELLPITAIFCIYLLVAHTLG